MTSLLEFARYLAALATFGLFAVSAWAWWEWRTRQHYTEGIVMPFVLLLAGVLLANAIAP